ncbi:hypothetical protein WG68_03685 [Arsukibacterium ikkense]|uniref:Class I SAM-dependent methyltransferase n=1 Tax=Arsukibacterium ikkense TaxID=336831 RepID=A0A0M2VBR8_9GAMM|nr:class I SAM-dependent methyltransferase [Arsukibacterium ikkense]KKO47040.1 hypothetical protein WG68_03685 [Arsukibacterium ikkense]
MKVCNANREFFLHVLSAVFEAHGKKPLIAELGVLRGENALNMYNILSPEHMVLIDSWSTDITKTYSPFHTLPPWINPIETYSYYFGGSLSEQSTFDKIYAECLGKFSDFSNVTIIREDTIKAIAKIRPATGIEKFDIIYVDASHQYEYVLRDLMYYKDLLAPHGFMILNDCCHSDAGTKQNLGVLEALTSFMKRTDYIPIALTNTDWSDVILVRKDSPLIQTVDIAISNSDVAYVELPYQLISSAKVIYGKQRANISFI